MMTDQTFSSCFHGGDGNRVFSSFESRNKSGVKDSVNTLKDLQPQSEHSRRHSESLLPQRLLSFINSFAAEKKLLPPTSTFLLDPVRGRFSVSVYLHRRAELSPTSQTYIICHLFFNIHFFKIYSIP